MKKSLVYLACLWTTIIYASAANISSSWTGGSSGTYAWEGSNWSTAPTYPNNGGGNNYYATIGDSSADRVIETSGNLTINGLAIVQSSTTGRTTLKLGGDLTFAGAASFAAGSGVTNTTGDLSRVMFDLSGHAFNYTAFSGASGFNDGGYALVSTGNQGGTFIMRGMAQFGVFDVRNNVTVQLASTGASYINGGLHSWSTEATLNTTYTSATAVGLYSSASATIGNLVIGSATNSARTWTQINTNSLRVKGNVSIVSYVGATGGDASRLGINSAGMFVAGNFTDQGSDSFNYGTGIIRFNGGIAQERSVSIGRTGLTTSFQVGEDATIAGNVVLTQNLTTTGTATVLGNSRLNLDEFELTAGTVGLESGATIAMELGLQPGSIHSTGDLTLSSFNLELVYDGEGWVDGTDLILFTYDGLLSETPILESLSSGFSYGQLVNDTLNKTIYLSDVSVVPEPHSILLIGIGGCVIAWKLRRRPKY